MIYCPNCGTANRDGSKFCNECGQRLAGAEGVRCPMCGALNRSGSVFCTQCGSRLIAVEAPAEAPAAPPAAPAPAGEEAVPEWLAKLREAAQREVSIGEEAPAPEQHEEEAPAAGPAEELPKAPVFVIEEGEAEWVPPDWLSELRARSAGAAEEAPAAPSEPLTEAPAAPVFAAEEAVSEVPDWLQRLRAEVTAEEAPAPPPTGPIGTEAAGPSFPTEAAPVFPAGPEEIPDWLKELGPPPSEQEVIPPAAGPVPGLAVEEEELPAWLREAIGFGEAPAEAPAPAAEEELAGEIPEWIMALRPGAQEPTIEAPPEGYEGDSYTEGILAGVQGLLPIELPMAKPPAPEDTGSLLESVPAEDEAVQIFRQVMESRPPARRMPKPSRPRIGRVRLLSALVLIAIMCLPLLTQGQWFTGIARTVPDSVYAAYEAVEEELAPNDAVVVAFDFDPSTAGEMAPLAQVLTEHLMARGARVIAVSTLPAGPQVAQDILDQAAAARGGKSYGVHYVNLGYLPGREAGMRDFLLNPVGAARRDFVRGQPAADLPALQGLQGIQDLKMLVIIGASAQDVRWWMEQAAGLARVPMIAGVSAAAEPYILPYYQGEGRLLQGVVAGVLGAGDYGALSGSLVSTARVESLQWGLLVALIAMLIVAAVSVFTPART